MSSFVIRNLKPITNKCCLIEPYLKFHIKKEFANYVVTFRMNDFVINTRNVDKNVAIADAKRSIYQAYLDLKNKRVKNIFGISGENLLEIVVSKQYKILYLEELEEKQKQENKKAKLAKLNRVLNKE